MSAASSLRIAGVTSTIRRGTVAARRASTSLAAVPERMIDQHGAPRLLRQQRGRDHFVGHDGGARAPALQPPRDQRRLDRRRRDDQDILAGKIGHRQRRLVGIADARERNGDAERRARSGRALDRDRAAHALDDPLGNGQAETGAAVFSRRAAVGLLELRENRAPGLRPRCRCRCRAPRWRSRRRCVRLDDDRDAAVFGELDGVAGEVEQHLAQPRRVADHVRRQALVDVAADFQSLGLGARPEQLDRLLDEGRERERPRREIEPSGLDLGEIENLLDQRQQRLARRLHRFQIRRLLGRERRVAEADRPCRECRSAACGFRATPWPGTATWRGSPFPPDRAPRPAPARPARGR